MLEPKFSLDGASPGISPHKVEGSQVIIKLLLN